MCIDQIIYIAQHYLLEQQVIQSFQSLGPFKLNCPSYNQTDELTLNDSLKIQIDDNISRADTVVVLLDKHRCQSKLLHYEIDTALRMSKTIIGIQVSRFSTVSHLSGHRDLSPALLVDAAIDECLSTRMIEEISKKIKVYTPDASSDIQLNLVSWINAASSARVIDRAIDRAIELSGRTV